MYYVPDPYHTPKHKIGLAISTYGVLSQSIKLLTRIMPKTQVGDWLWDCFGLYRDRSLDRALTDFMTRVKFLPSIYADERPPS